MKNILKLIAVGALCVPIGPGAYAISTVTPNCCPNSCPISCSSVTYASQCTNNSFCTSCKTTTLTNTNGVVETTNRRITTTCNSCRVTPSCNITSTTYKCASGYYGTATSASSGCTKCPANATCSGGNGSTFVCNVGYQKNDAGTGCEERPMIIACRSGQYRGEDGECKDCPSPGTSLRNASGITSCYIPSGYTGSDTSGSYEYAANCYYKE